MRNNILHTVKNKLCTGCGICEDVCPKHCITITRKNNELRPVVDNDLCLGEKCGKCLKVCPGVGVDLDLIAHKQFQDKGLKEDKYIGRYVALHTGYSLDEDIRLHSASGGMVCQFLIYLLENKIVDGAVVTGYGMDNITPVSYIAKTKEDVINAHSSKYCPVSLNKIGNEVANSDGRYVIVGLPCHIQGFRKRMLIDRKFRERIVGLFAIYCSSTRTFSAQDYLLRRYNVKKEEVSFFSFRDNGCLGDLIIDSGGVKHIQVPYSKYYVHLLRSFFKPHRCLTCIDHYGELADISFGDIHIVPYSNDHTGISSWITRNEYWEQFFKKAVEEGYIRMEDIDAEILNKSQHVVFSQKRRAQSVINMDKLIGRDTPRYDTTLDKPIFRDYISNLICFGQQFIGRRKPLWFIIDFINRNKG